MNKKPQATTRKAKLATALKRNMVRRKGRIDSARTRSAERAGGKS